MRVALLSRSTHPLHPPGGLERAVYHLARHLAACGVKTLLFTRPATCPGRFLGEVVEVRYGSIKGLRHGRVLDRTFRSGEKVDEADTVDRKMQFLYADGDQLIFMDTKDYEQIPISRDQVGDAVKFLTENLEVAVLFWNGKPQGDDGLARAREQLARAFEGARFLDVFGEKGGLNRYASPTQIEQMASECAAVVAATAD